MGIKGSYHTLEHSSHTNIQTTPTDPIGTILSSSICLPRSKEATIPRSHASLNLLSCLHTLATSAQATPEKLATSLAKKYPKDEYLCITRFTCEALLPKGRWGLFLFRCAPFSTLQLMVGGGATLRPLSRLFSSVPVLTSCWEGLDCMVGVAATTLRSGYATQAYMFYLILLLRLTDLCTLSSLSPSPNIHSLPSPSLPSPSSLSQT